MKKIFLFGILSTLFLAVGCQKEELKSAAEDGQIAISATFEQLQGAGTKATETDFHFFWEAGDKIAIAKTGGAGFATFKARDTGASTPFFGNPATFFKYAVYPQSIAKTVSGEQLTVAMPAVYDIADKMGTYKTTNSPLLATFEGQPGELFFKHIGALLRFTANNLPAGATKFVFSTNKVINGDFAVENSGADYVIRAKESAEDEGKTVTISFAATTEVKNGVVFYIPMPVGTYTGYEVNVFNANNELIGYYGTEGQFTLNRKSCGTKTITFMSIIGTIEDGEYTEIGFKEAVQNGGEVTLENDITLTSPLVIANNVIINLNGHSITPANATLTADAETGCTATQTLITVARGAHLTLNGGSIDTGMNPDIYSAIQLVAPGIDGETGEKASLTVNGTTIMGYYYGIVANGNRHNTEIVINDGNISGICANDNLGIYHPQEGILTINGGTISGHDSAVEMRGGTLNITGGTFISTAQVFRKEANGSGNSIEGAAVAVSQHTTNKALSVNISGGDFSGFYALYEEDLMDEAVENISMNITGGNFHGKVYSENCPNNIPSQE